MFHDLIIVSKIMLCCVTFLVVATDICEPISCCFRFAEILAYHIEDDNPEKVLETCQQYGVEEPSLWSEALAYLSDHTERNKPFVEKILARSVFSRFLRS